jgi:sulfur carrier protein ThiS
LGREGEKTRAELEAEGWERGFVADEPRLSEAAETYREIGLEVLLLPVTEDDAECTACLRADPGRYRVIYTRPAVEIVVNGRPRRVARGTTLRALVDAERGAPGELLVLLNGEAVPSRALGERELGPGDRVEMHGLPFGG